MSESSDAIYVESKATVICAGCGTVEDASADTETGAVYQLDHTLEREGWRMEGDKAYCADCACRRAKEQAKRSRKRSAKGPDA